MRSLRYLPLFLAIAFTSLSLGGVPALAAKKVHKEQTKKKSPKFTNIGVILDRATLLKVPEGAEMIVVGNPAIADVAVQKNKVMVITGRSPGRTNFVALDSSGTIISESVITVTAIVADGRITVQRGTERSSYDCAPRCLPTVAFGDDSNHFSYVLGQITARDNAATSLQGVKK